MRGHYMRRRISPYMSVGVLQSVRTMSIWTKVKSLYLHFPGDTWTETLAYVLFWGTASVVTFGVILFNGRDFVDAPKLVQKEKMD